MHLFSLIFVVSIWLFVGCEKPYQPAGKDDDTEQETTDGRKVKITIANAEGTTDISQVCTRISYCVFTANGELYTVKHQASSDNDFGCKTLYIADGNYRLVVIAHSGAGNISIESEDKIKFKDNKITDTFAYSTDIDITEDCSLNLVLNRIVANVHVVIPGAMPQDVKQMEFYYTGEALLIVVLLDMVRLTLGRLNIEMLLLIWWGRQQHLIYIPFRMKLMVLLNLPLRL